MRIIDFLSQTLLTPSVLEMNMSVEDLLYELRRRQKKEGMQAVLDDFERRNVSYQDMEAVMNSVKMNTKSVSPSTHKTQNIYLPYIFGILIAVVAAFLIVIYFRGTDDLLYPWLIMSGICCLALMAETLFLWAAVNYVYHVAGYRFLTSLTCKVYSWIIIGAVAVIASFIGGIPGVVLFVVLSTIAEAFMVSFFFTMPLSQAILAFFLMAIMRIIIMGLLYIVVFKELFSTLFG